MTTGVARIGITFFDPNPNSGRYFVEEKFIATVSTHHGIIYFEGYDSEKKKFFTHHEEHYEEAVRIVKEGDNR